MTKTKTISPRHWEEIEKNEHNHIYQDSRPFSLNTYEINVEHVLWWEDYCYKKGRRKDRGHRTRRVFELINLSGLKGKKILDAGCGNGQYSVFLALFGADVYGIDISPVGIEVAGKIAVINKVADHCHFSSQSLAGMNFADNSFDIVLMHEVLHHAIKYPGVPEEIFRVLKKDGLLICAESLDGNIFFSFGRIFTMRGKEAKGDVVLTLSDIKEFAENFSEYRIELMSLLFMSKRIFKDMLDFPPIRWLLYVLKKADDLLFVLFPGLKKYCGEAILVAKK